MSDEGLKTIFSYQKLDVWQLANEFSLKVYKITREYPNEEKYGLVSQINRAVISIASNIAEGNNRSSYKERIHFIEISYGSLMEVACQLEISKELNLISENQWYDIQKDILTLAKKLSSLREHYKSKV